MSFDEHRQMFSCVCLVGCFAVPFLGGCARKDSLSSKAGFGSPNILLRSYAKAVRTRDYPHIASHISPDERHECEELARAHHRYSVNGRILAEAVQERFGASRVALFNKRLFQPHEIMLDGVLLWARVDPEDWRQLDEHVSFQGGEHSTSILVNGNDTGLLAVERHGGWYIASDESRCLPKYSSQLSGMLDSLTQEFIKIRNAIRRGRVDDTNIDLVLTGNDAIR